MRWDLTTAVKCFVVVAQDVERQKSALWRRVPHANELHPIRRGTGPKARLRFDALTVGAAFAAQDLTASRSSTGAGRPHLIGSAETGLPSEG